ncbi:hypothetical protein SBRY_60274 [Actinacidiphila bryophytorum]|uniref:Uncharacterized protein n=1 Tax=Actinacidiphila bryophytorum TaxID=1436133 RepID=A0A9W4MET8_9ACTN|nr:hypothetical protein SBRY_60274 [Actinacidiphila bryophytorum]
MARPAAVPPAPRPQKWSRQLRIPSTPLRRRDVHASLMTRSHQSHRAHRTAEQHRAPHGNAPRERRTPHPATPQKRWRSPTARTLRE